MIILKRKDVNLLILFGGYTNQTSTSLDSEFQKQLDDLWVYNLETNIWRECFQNSPYSPQARYGSSMTLVEDAKFMLFGGVNSGVTLSDLWLFNIDTNMWTEIQQSTLVVNENWPPESQYSTLTLYSGGIILYGGSYMVNIQSFMEKLNAANDEGTEVNLVVNNARKKNYNSELWILKFDDCNETNCVNGYCNYGRCICNSGYWGTNCNNAYCSSSYCYYDFDILSDQVCYHCTDHGRCVSGKCVCDDGWLGEECSILDCYDNCSNVTGESKVGDCIITSPISQCNCYKYSKRGGDYCQIIYCLNDCSGKGDCDYTKGVCTCDLNYYGEDCSIYFLTFNTETN